MEFHLRIAEMMRRQQQMLPINAAENKTAEKASSEEIPQAEKVMETAKRSLKETEDSDMEPDGKRLRIDETPQSGPPSPQIDVANEAVRTQKDSSDEKSSSPGRVTISAYQLFEGMLENNPENRLETLTGLIQTLQEMKDRSQKILPSIPQSTPAQPAKQLNMDEEVVVLGELSAKMKSLSDSGSSLTRSNGSLPSVDEPQVAMKSNGVAPTSTNNRIQVFSTQTIPRAPSTTQSGSATVSQASASPRVAGMLPMSRAAAMGHSSSAHMVAAMMPSTSQINPMNFINTSVYSTTSQPSRESNGAPVSSDTDTTKIPALAAAPLLIPQSTATSQPQKMNPPQMVHNPLTLSPHELLYRNQQQQLRQIQLQSQHQQQQKAMQQMSGQRQLPVNLSPQQLHQLQMSIQKEQHQKQQKEEEAKRTLQRLQQNQLLYQQGESLKKRILDGIHLACGGRASAEQLAEFLKQPYFALMDNGHYVRVHNPFLQQTQLSSLVPPAQPGAAPGLRVPHGGPAGVMDRQKLQQLQAPPVSGMLPPKPPSLTVAQLQQLKMQQQQQQQQSAPKFQLPRMVLPPQGASQPLMTLPVQKTSPPRTSMPSTSLGMGTVTLPGPPSLHLSPAVPLTSQGDSARREVPSTKSTPQASPRAKMLVAPKESSPFPLTYHNPSVSPSSVPTIVETRPREANKWSIFQLPLPTHLHVQCNCFPNCQ